MKIIDLMKTNKKYISPFRKKEVRKLYNEYLNAGYGLMQFGRELTMLLMCASFPLFSFDSHHCRSSMLESTTSSWRLVSCCIHGCKDLMPIQHMRTSLLRVEMSLNHSGSSDMLAQRLNLSD